ASRASHCARARWSSIPRKEAAVRTHGSWTRRPESVLARVVESVYWLARYLERAENTARLVSVNTHLLLDLRAGYALGWQPLIDITASRGLYDARHSRSEERDVVQF